MAEGKKSFVAYSDWRDTFNELNDEDAGKLIKHIFAYVNDENPTTDSVVVRAVFAQIKNTLKRDLQKWEKQLEQRREAGKKSAKVRSTKKNDRSTTVNERQRNSTDSVSVSVSVSVNVDKQVIFNKWLSYRKEMGKPIKVKSTLTNLINKFNSEPLEKVEYVVNASIESGWQGLFWDKYVEKPKQPINNGLQKPQKLKDLYD